MSEEQTHEEGSTSESATKLDQFLLVTVATAAFIVFGLLAYSLYFQLHTYKFGLEEALKDKNSALALAYARAGDFAVTKTSTVFLGFVLAFLGALFVLRTARVPFLLKAAGAAKGNISLQTSSPGLVMITLGVLTINLALYSKSFVSVDVTSPGRIRNNDNELGRDKKPTESNGMSFRLPPFAAGSSQLSSAQISALTKVADEMLANPGTEITIEAEGDSGGSTEYNLGLADRRATTVKQFLVARQGTMASRVKTTSYGKERPFSIGPPPPPGTVTVRSQPTQ